MPPLTPVEIQGKKDQVITGSIINYYRDHVSAWFQRYGVLKSPEGVIVRFPLLKPRVVQRRMFAEAERCLLAGIPWLMMVLKPRKDGASTGAQGIIYHWLRRWHGRAAAVMGDIIGTSDTVFELFRMFAQNDTFEWGDGFPRLNPEDSQTDDIVLGNKSTYKKVTAGSNNAGRSGTIQVANMTEVAYYPDAGERDPALGFLGSWHGESPSSLAIMDSTANGPFGTFYDYWMDPHNSWAKIFVAWYEEPEHAIAFADPEERDEFARSLDTDELEELSKYRVSLEQLRWRRKMIADKCGGDADKFRQEYPSDAQEAFLRKSRTRFRVESLNGMERAAATRPAQIVTLSRQADGSVSPYPDPAGSVYIWEMPKVGCRYLVSIDSCTGRDQQQQAKHQQPDWHDVGVWRDEYLDLSNRHQYPPALVAQHWSQLEVDIMVEIAACLSIFYGMCIAIPEVNGCGLYPVKKLQELEIPVWERRRENPQSNTVEVSGGWMTTEGVRKTIIDSLAARISKWTPENPTFECYSMHMINQFRKFIVDKNGHVAAMPGEKDDAVMEAAIGLYNISAATEMRSNERKRVSVEKMLKSQHWRLGTGAPVRRN